MKPVPVNPRAVMTRAVALARPGMVAVMLAVCHGCLTAPSAPRLISSHDAAGKIPAIRTAAGSGDTTGTAQLVDELDSDDPAIRLYAIRALREITGQTFDYRYFDDEIERQPAIMRWRAWLAGNKPNGGVAPDDNAGAAPR